MAGDVVHVPSSLVSQCMTQVIDAMLHHINQFITFPVTQGGEQREISIELAVVGAIDCTLVAIAAPPVD